MIPDTHHQLPARQQQPAARLARALTMDPSQHTGVQKHGFAAGDSDQENGVERPNGADEG
jgi:hypothetical protein